MGLFLSSSCFWFIASFLFGAGKPVACDLVKRAALVLAWSGRGRASTWHTGEICATQECQDASYCGRFATYGPLNGARSMPFEHCCAAPFYRAIFGLDLMLIFLVPNDRADLSRSGSTQRATTGGSPDPKNGIPSTLYRGEKSRILRTRIGRQYLAEVKIDVDGDITRNRNG